MTGSPHGNGGQRHCHGNCIEHALRAKALYESCRGDRISPVCSRFGSEDPQRRSVDEMALNIEGIVNCTVHAEKPPATPTECRVGAGPACREPRPKRGRYLSRTLAFARNHERSMNRKCSGGRICVVLLAKVQRGTARAQNPVICNTKGTLNSETRS